MSVSIKGLTNLKDVIIRNIPGYIPVEIGISLSTNLAGHTASKLNDGRYLITGGTTTAANSGITANTWIGTASGSSIAWIASTPLPVALKWHAASVLLDGRIFVTGGTTNGTSAVDTTYFGTVTGNTIAWVAGTALGAVRMEHTSTTVISDGRVLIAGGRVNGGYSNSTVFATITGNTIAYVASTNMINGLANHTMSYLTDGRVYLIGGTRSGTFSEPGAYAGTISGNTISWQNLGNFPTGIQRHTATILPDGRMAVAGGFNGTVPLTTVYYGTVFPDAPTNTPMWVTGNSLPAARSYHKSVPLGANTLVVTCGLDSASNPTNTVYNMNTQPIVTWVTSPNPLPLGRKYSSMWKLSDDKVLLTTGEGGPVTATTYIGTISGNAVSWAASTAYPLAATRTATSDGTLIPPSLGQPTGRMLLLGGSTNGSNALGNAIFGTPDILLSSITWTSSPNGLPSGRMFAAKVVLPDGRILVYGGTSTNNTPTYASGYFGTISGTGITWVAATDMPSTASQFTIVLLKDGRILRLGTGDCHLGTISGNTVSWVAVAIPYPGGVQAPATSLLPDGRVVVTGGISSSAQGAVFLGTVSGNTVTWVKDIGGMPTTKYAHQMVTLADGRLMVVGGTGGSDAAVYFGTVNY